MNRTIEFYDSDGEVMEIPAKWEVCGRCNGEGAYPHPDIDGFSPHEARRYYGEAWDDFVDDYLGGAYDVPCEECGGKRVVLVPDYDRMTDHQKHEREQYEIAEMQYRMERDYERRAFVNHRGI